MKILQIIESWQNDGRVDRTFVAQFDEEIQIGLEFDYEEKTYRITYKIQDDEIESRVCYAEVRFLAIEM